MTAPQVILDVDVQNFDDVFRVNIQGIFNGCKAVTTF